MPLAMAAMFFSTGISIFSIPKATQTRPYPGFPLCESWPLQESRIRIARLVGSYSVNVSEEKPETLRADVGLCADCRFMRLMESDRGSTFYLCERSATDASFPKYPRLPVLRCMGYERLTEDREPE